MTNKNVLILLIIIISSQLFGQIKQLDNLIFENLIIYTPYDSLITKSPKTSVIIDTRNQKFNTLGITQIKKYKYIPIDQYLVLNHDIADFLDYKIQQDSIKIPNKLVIEKFSLWNDTKSVFGKSRVLSAYSYLTDENNQKIKEWQWEIRNKDKKKLEPEENISAIFDKWLIAQTDSLKLPKQTLQLSLYKYRRIFNSWFDFIILPDGYIINGNLTLNFPKDHQTSWFFGSPGIYYRKSQYHESITVNGFDQHWIQRISPTLIWRNNTTLRIGINSFNRKEFSHIDIWNIFMVNLGMSTSIEYRPNFYRGVFFGGGLYLNVNGLPYIPEKIKIIEPGVLMTIGITLP